MKYLSLLVLFSFVFLQTGFTQVKKQYVDTTNSATTVVVKENNASDLDILNSQFDLNSIGMGQVIKIKTENLKPKGEVIPKAEVPQAEVATPTPTKKIVKAAANPPKVRTKATEIHYRGIGKSKKVKTKRKRIKKRRKFKKRKRRKVSCYSF